MRVQGGRVSAQGLNGACEGVRVQGACKGFRRSVQGQDECARVERSVRGLCKECTMSVQGGMISAQGLRGVCKVDAVSVQEVCKECMASVQKE